jgi:hypothetical protein
MINFSRLREVARETARGFAIIWQTRRTNLGDHTNDMTR